MPWWAYLVAGLSLPLVFFLWAAVHEASHAAAVRLFDRNARVGFRIYPHVDAVAGFRWAAVSWTGAQLTPGQYGWVYYAPRIPGAVGLVLFGATGLLPAPLTLLWALVWGGAVVDVIYGSVGYSPYSDLRRTALAWGISPWWLRVLGFVPSLFAVGVAITGLVLLLRD